MSFVAPDTWFFWVDLHAQSEIRWLTVIDKLRDDENSVYELNRCELQPAPVVRADCAIGGQRNDRGPIVYRVADRRPIRIVPKLQRVHVVAKAVNVDSVVDYCQQRFDTLASFERPPFDPRPAVNTKQGTGFCPTEK